MLFFVNDYCEGAHPAILQKLLETNMEKLSGYLGVLKDQNPEAVGGELPGDDFYYSE